MNKEKLEGFLLGFILTTALWCGIFGYIIGKLV